MNLKVWPTADWPGMASFILCVSVYIPVYEIPVLLTNNAYTYKQFVYIHFVNCDCFCVVSEFCASRHKVNRQLML